MMYMNLNTPLNTSIILSDNSDDIIVDIIEVKDGILYPVNYWLISSRK